MSKVHGQSIRFSFSGTRDEARQAISWLFENVRVFRVDKLEVSTDDIHPEWDGCFVAYFDGMQDATKFKTMFGGLA